MSPLSVPEPNPIPVYPDFVQLPRFKAHVQINDGGTLILEATLTGSAKAIEQVVCSIADAFREEVER